MGNLSGNRVRGIPHLHALVCHEDPDVGHQAIKEGLLTLRNFYSSTAACLPPPSNIHEKIDGSVGVQFVYQRGLNGQPYFGIGYGGTVWFDNDEMLGRTGKKSAPESIRFHLLLMLAEHNAQPVIPRIRKHLDQYQSMIIDADIIAGIDPGSDFQSSGFETTPVITKFTQKHGNRCKRYGIIAHRKIVDGVVGQVDATDVWGLSNWNITTTEWTRNNTTLILDPAFVDEALYYVNQQKWKDTFTSIRDEYREQFRKNTLRAINAIGSNMTLGDAFQFPNIINKSKSVAPNLKETLFTAKVIKEASRNLDQAIMCYDLPGWKRINPEGVVIDTCAGPVKVIDLNYDRIRTEKHIRAKLAKEARKGHGG